MTNDNFKEIPENKWFDLYENQVCVVVLDSEEIFAGHFEEPEGESTTFDLQGCYQYTFDFSKNLSKWVRASGSEYGMSYCGLEVDTIENVFVPKKDLGLDACMELWS